MKLGKRLFGNLCGNGLLVIVAGVLWVSSAQSFGQVDVYRDRLKELNKQSADVAVQLNALNEFLNSADSRVVQLETAVTELEDMTTNLEDINKKNLIKVIFQLAFETYSTIDKVTGIAKTGVESVANHGIAYAAGRIAFEETGEATRKAMGLDENSYYSSRCVSINKLTEESAKQSEEISKVYWALDKDIAYYRALKIEETGEDPGERGAIFYKNIVVREKIVGAISAIESLVITIGSQKGQAESDRDWLLGEGESISSLIEGVELQLATALQEEKEEALEGEAAALLEKITDPGDPPEFSYRPMTVDDDQFVYLRARHAAGVARIKEILEPIIPQLNSLWAGYESANTQANDDYTVWNTQYGIIIEVWSKKSFMNQEDFRGLLSTLYDLENMKYQIEMLQKAEDGLTAVMAEFKPIKSVFIPFNDLKVTSQGCASIAAASTITSYVLGEGETAPTDLPPVYTMEQYTIDTGKSPSWAYESFNSMPTTVSFDGYYEQLYLWEQLLESIDEAQLNAQKALAAFRSHYQDIQSAIDRVTGMEKQQVDSLELVALGMTIFLNTADAMSLGKAFCAVDEADVYYNNLHNNRFNVHTLNSTMGALLNNNVRAEEARVLWDEYLDFIGPYQENARAYAMASNYAVAVRSRVNAGIPTFMAEVRAAIDLANEVGGPMLGNSLSQMEDMSSRFSDAKTFLTPALSWEEARELPEVAVLEDMDDSVDPSMEEPFLNHPLAKAVPAFGLLLIKEKMDIQFDELMAMAVRDEDAMWDVVYGISGELNAWRDGQESGLLSAAILSIAQNIKGPQLYAKRMAWEEEFGPPFITSQSNHQAVNPGSTVTLSVNVSSKYQLSFTWYRDNWFGDDEVVGNGSTLTVASSAGLEIYYCEISNINGTVYSGRIEVYPAVKPEIAFQPQSVNAEAGKPAQLQADFYLVTGSGVEVEAAWYVSDGADPAGSYSRIPDSSLNVLNIRSVLATRYYYYEVSNSWGTTRTDTVAVFVTTNEDYPALVPPPEDLVGYSNVLFSYPFMGKNIDSFEWQAPGDGTGLGFDTDFGVVSGILTLAPAQTITFQVRGVRDLGDQTLVSEWVPVSIQVMPQGDYPGNIRESYFTAEELLDEDVCGILADPDGDGLANIVEYALGSDPRSPDMNGLPLFEKLGDRCKLSFRKPVAPAGFYYIVEYTRDMKNWIPIKSIEGNCIDSGNGQESVVYQSPEIDFGEGLIVMRVRVIEV